MQKLIFETNWDKTIAPIDRQRLTAAFYAHKQSRPDIELQFFRKASNHKNELLVTVIIHNFSNETVCLENTVIAYSEKGVPRYAHSFTVPIAIEAKTSMPWTFIYPSEREDVDSVNFTIFHS